MGVGENGILRIVRDIAGGIFMNRALNLRGLTVRFERFTLGPLDLALEPGRVFGLVDPNRSGKTTTIR